MADPCEDLIKAGRIFHAKGWMEGTGGNLSARHDEKSFWITSSGKHKGELGGNDFVRVDLDGGVVERREEPSKPSAETSIHQLLYKRFPIVGAVYHVHSVEANLVSMFTEGEMVRLAPLEVIKGFNIWTEDPEVSIPVFRNHGEVDRITADFAGWLDGNTPLIPVMLIRRHGVTVWGETPAKARNYVELIEYIFKYMVGARQLGL
ncbi:MAG: methylthioribulose 1-phosphate dehydratase [Candidatus Sumerlaeia bacterium]|nr:methylthioribulose 1-phosphate dehydratase [Candidatus Sumerlaeia bacterium]